MGNNTQSLPTFSTIMIRDFDDERRAQPRHRGRGRGNEKPALVLNAPWDGRRAHRSSARGSTTNQHLSVQELLIKTLPSARRRALYAGPGDVNRPYNMPAAANETAQSSDTSSILPLQLYVRQRLQEDASEEPRPSSGWTIGKRVQHNSIPIATRAPSRRNNDSSSSVGSLESMCLAVLSKNFHRFDAP